MPATNELREIATVAMSAWLQAQAAHLKTEGLPAEEAIRRATHEFVHRFPGYPVKPHLSPHH
jgi:hypothetical protein